MAARASQSTEGVAGWNNISAARVSAAVNRYGLKEPQQDGDLFEKSGRVHLNRYMQCLPEATQAATLRELDLLDSLRDHIGALEKQIETRIGNREEMLC